MKKLVEQFEVEKPSSQSQTEVELSEEKATILFWLDVMNKNLIDFETHPVRKVRQHLDRISQEIMKADGEKLSKTLFELRQWYSSYRVSESNYIQTTFEDFKKIVWEFADHLSEDAAQEKKEAASLQQALSELREAVETNSIDGLRSKSKEFIQLYVQSQSQREQRQTKRLKQTKQNLSTIKKQLVEAHHSMRTDHLTGALNRRSFDEQFKNQWKLCQFDQQACSLIILDIDHFKKINDSYGHDIGDFVLKECVQTLQHGFSRKEDVVARIGGEEFAVILPALPAPAAAEYAEKVMNLIRAQVYVHEGVQIRFTVSMGLADYQVGESWDQWMKRADTALYQSKNAGRNRVTLATALKAAA